jgi:hypothetical protein
MSGLLIRRYRNESSERPARGLSKEPRCLPRQMNGSCCGRPKNGYIVQHLQSLQGKPASEGKLQT